MALKVSDKAPLDWLAGEIMGSIASACEQFEANHPGFRVGDIKIVWRVALKPATEGEKRMVVADMDEGANVQITEIPIEISRIPT